MKKSVSLPILFLLFLSVVLVTFPYIGTVRAIGTVYIRSDGSTEGAGLIFSDGVYWFTGDIYGQIVIEKDGVTVEGSEHILHAMNEGSILLENRSGVVLRNIEIVDAPFGIKIVGGRNNEITQSNCSIRLENTSSNSIYLNKKISLLFSNASKNIVTQNNITGSLIYGIKLQRFSNENIICENNVTDNTSGIEFHGESNNNTVYGNNIVYNSDGLIFYSSFNNLIYDNEISFNSNVAAYFRGAGKNRFFRNDFVENGNFIFGWYSSNVWDNGKQGNYWSNYNGTDIDGDGIGEEPYLILTLHLDGEHFDSDNYPLMEPTIIPEFPSFIVIPLFLTATFLTFLFKRKITKKNSMDI